MRLLITGGAGFIGRYLCKHLVAQKHSVTIFDIQSPKDDLDAVENFIGSVTDPRGWRNLHGQHYDCVIHMASLVGTQAVRKRRLSTTNIILEGTRQALLYCHEERIPIIYVSTSEVYGNAKSPLKEDSSESVLGLVSNPRWAYSSAKLSGEHMTMAYHEELGVSTAIIRPFNITGAEQINMVLPIFVQKALTNQTIEIRGNGSQVRCFLAVQDAVEAIAKLAEGLVKEKIGNGQIFNLGNPANRITIANLASSIKEAAGSQSEIVFDQIEDDIYERVPDITKLSNLINWQPQRSLSNIINAVVYDLRRRQNNENVWSHQQSA